MSDMSTINSSTSDAIDQLVVDAGRMHKVINGTAAETITVEDGSLIPSLRKAMLENLYYKTPVLDWQKGSVTQVFNQLYAFTEPTSNAVSWWYAPSATATNPVSMGDSPATDSNWRVVLDSATLTGLYATIDSPNFTGLPTAPTMDDDDNSTSIATTAFVNALILKVFQDINAEKIDAATITVTGDASIFNLSATDAAVTGKLTVQDLEILGEVTGIQTSVDGEDIAPKSITTTEKLEVGGDTTLHGTFQIADKTILLGDGTVVDLTNIGSAGTVAVSADLDSVVGNDNFVWDATSLNTPILGSSGKGVSIAKTATDVTQVTWPDGETSPWTRVLSGTTWSAWKNAISSNAEAVEGTATNIAVSPAGMAAFVAQYGIGTDSLTNVADLDDVTVGSGFSYSSGAENAPTSGAGGRGIVLPTSPGNATQLVIENVAGNMYIRYSADGTWAAWQQFQGEPGTDGNDGAPGASAYEIYLGTVPEGETPMTQQEWLASLQGSSFTVNATGTTAERDNYDTEAKGFAFLDTTTGLLYIKNSATSADWSDGIPFKGDAGTPGVNGSTWYNGSGAPASATGANGDFYLDTTALDVYKKVSNAWSVITNLQGSVWITGTAAPTSTVGKNGDLYLVLTTDTTASTNGNVYQKASGSWTSVGNIRGPAGSGSSYTLPIASATVLGGVKIGSGVSIAADGTISVTGGGSVTFATTAEAQAATSTTVVMSPARTREFMEKHGFTASFTTQATDLNSVVTGDLFNYASTTLNIPGTGGYGRGIAIPSGTGYVTQLAIENDSNLMFIRYQTNGTWGAWAQASGGSGGSVTFATTAEAQAGTSTTVAMSPARTREQFEPLGFGSTYTNEVANLNTLTKGQFFNWGASSTNTPVASSYGRGIMIPAGTGYATQLGIVNDTGATYVRFNNNGTWTSWVAVGGSGTAAVMKASGTGHAAGLAPDPGATAGTTKFLREDATWAVPAGGSGGGGGAAVFTAGQLTNTISLNASSATTIAMTAGTTTIDSTMLYKFSAVLLLQGPAGAKVDLTLTDIGPDIFRMRAHFTKADGTIGSARSTQASGAMTVELFDQDSTIIVDGIMHSSYYGTNGPQFQGKINTGDWCNAIKGSVITMTPIVTVPST
ncbi:hypothetical protein pEaSNUABM56_00094 [Erwinia phage pEa_SNUABM_56]|uniref:Putative tail fiber protein n=1 Tax=Erwinia phage pEp_SNUABM_01 TaxID=2601643 RepID=A0A5J6DB89_9CAUD|nr:tail fiber protein [Erwinia phage pEp_SNUABM_01]QEQ94893.1 putative tail fiber protein [Erwinia phage pEp_SNUABM_01]UYL85139.1 hypothetical protein pEaSNUABM56_00094 [Erwinia phage pEa_SNUABM_56]